MSTEPDPVKKNDDGLRLRQVGDIEGAVEAFTQAITLNPNFESAYRNRAEAFRRLGKTDQATGDLDKAETMAQARLLASRPVQRWSDGWQWPVDEDTLVYFLVPVATPERAAFILCCVPVAMFSLASRGADTVWFVAAAIWGAMFLLATSLTIILLATGLMIGRKRDLAKAMYTGLAVGFAALVLGRFVDPSFVFDFLEAWGAELPE